MYVTGNYSHSVQTTLHYSWDYAQQVHFPHHAQQVGPIYFKTPRKCNVFRVCSEGSGKYLFIDLFRLNTHFSFDVQLYIYMLFKFSSSLEKELRYKL